MYRSESLRSMSFGRHIWNSIRARCYQDFLLQGEIDQGLAWHLNLVSLGHRFGSCSHAGANARTDRRSFAAPGDRTDK